ncbi:hypothetical protein [Streptomyces griseoluteus]|uniref:hypothetical protein n=1 Tax=Streptomyces griseoluteus TaxID=29306 RepID=UPI0036F5B80A
MTALNQGPLAQNTIDGSHFLLSLDGVPAMHRSVGGGAVALTKAKISVGEYGCVGARVTLTYEITDALVTDWPEPA